MYEMRAVFLGFILTMVHWSRGQENQTFDGDVRDFAIGDTFLYVITDKRLTLYQLNHSFTSVKMKELNGNQKLNNSDETYLYKVNILLPFIKNNTVITCGTKKCGYCEIFDLNDISKSVHSEEIEVGSLDLEDSTIGFFVDVEKKSYIMAGRLPRNSNHENCANPNFLTLRDTQDGIRGIFSPSDDGSSPSIVTRHKEDLQFVDGFQISSHIYVFLNLLKEPKVQLISFNSKINKATTLMSLSGATLGCCEDMARPRLLSSSVIQSPAGGTGQVFWAGVFTENKTSNPVNTVVAIYDISPSSTQNKDPDFCFVSCTKEDTPRPPPLTPLSPLAVVFKYSSMTSVLAVRHNSWIVLFIGTEDGQLIKLPVDKNYKAACTKVLYKSDDDRQVFPKMHLDPVDGRHVYMALRNQMFRVPVAQCSEHTSLKKCWSAQDPFCGWCESMFRCSFMDDCLQPSAWISIPEDSQQQSLVSYQVEKSISGEEITLTVRLHLNFIGKEQPNFACNFPGDLCDRPGPAPVFPQCSCLFSSSKLPAQALDVPLKIRVGKASLSEKLMLTNCSDITGPPTSALCSRCVNAGCSWMNGACSWTKSVNSGFLQDVCSVSQSGMNYSEPEIISVLPSVVSFHGKNHAQLTGKNMGHVIGVRLKGDMDCSTKESPVWNRNVSSLTFHIPSGNKGSVSVCALLSDGRCLGKATITYKSSPICTGILPTTTWASGNRRINISGSQLEFVEGVVHGHTPQIITANYSPRGIWYYTPPYDVNTNLPVTSTVSLKVANQTLPCSQLNYHPDPEFTSFTVTKTGSVLQVTIQKNADKLNIHQSEISVLGVQGENQDVECVMESIQMSNGTDSIICEIKNTPVANIKSLRISVGHFTENLEEKDAHLAIILLFVVIIIIIIVVVFVSVVWFLNRKQKRMAEQMNKQLELLECNIRNDI